MKFSPLGVGVLAWQITTGHAYDRPSGPAELGAGRKGRITDRVGITGEPHRNEAPNRGEDFGNVRIREERFLEGKQPLYALELCVDPERRVRSRRTTLAQQKCRCQRIQM